VGFDRSCPALVAATAAVALACALPAAALAETMESALAYAYQNNPQLNAQRAQARSTDENVPQALSGYRPRVSITSSVGENYSDQTQKSVVGTPSPRPGGAADQHAIYSGTSGTTTPWVVGATATQTLYNGNQTANRTRAAESQVSASREAL